MTQIARTALLLGGPAHNTQVPYDGGRELTYDIWQRADPVDDTAEFLARQVKHLTYKYMGEYGGQAILALDGVLLTARRYRPAILATHAFAEGIADEIETAAMLAELQNKAHELGLTWIHCQTRHEPNSVIVRAIAYKE